MEIKRESLNRCLGRVLYERDLSHYPLLTQQLGRFIYTLVSLCIIFYAFKGAIITFDDLNLGNRYNTKIVPLSSSENLYITKRGDALLLEAEISKESKLYIYDGKEVKTVIIQPSNSDQAPDLTEFIRQ